MESFLGSICCNHLSVVGELSGSHVSQLSQFSRRHYVTQLSGNIQNFAAFETKSLFSLVTQLKTFLLQSTVVKQFTLEIKWWRKWALLCVKQKTGTNKRIVRFFVRPILRACSTRAEPKIQQTKMLVTCQRFGDLFLFGLVWQYSSYHKTYNKSRFKGILLPL